MTRKLQVSWLIGALLLALALLSHPAYAETTVPAATTCSDWVHAALAPHVVLADPYLGDYIVLDDTQVVTVPDWCTIFGDSFTNGVPADPYTALSDPVVHTFYWPYDGQTYSMTAGEMGYQPYFDQWHFTEHLF